MIILETLPCFSPFETNTPFNVAAAYASRIAIARSITMLNRCRQHDDK